MINSSNIIVTVFHEGVANYFHDFISSVKSQLTNDYQLLIFNDSKYDIYVDNLSGVENLSVINFPNNLNILENRIWMINYLQRISCDFIHFIDADDTINTNYLSLSCELLNGCDLVCHDFNLVDREHQSIEANYWKERFESNPAPIPFEFIKDKNIIGLGNTSIKRSLLDNLEIRQKLETTIADWFIFTQILLAKEPKILFTSEAVFNYRQHNNLANLLLDDFDSIIQKMKMVKGHFEALQSININRYDGYIGRFDDLLTNFNIALYSKYKENRIKLNFFWWEEIFKILTYYENRYKR